MEKIDRKIMIELMNQTIQHFNPENPSFINEEQLDYELTNNDLTVLSRDFLIAEDNQGTRVGFAGLLKSSKKGWWVVMLYVLPAFLSTHFPGELFDEIISLAKKQSAPELRFYIHASFAAIHDKFQGLRIKPVQFFWKLRLDDFKNYPKYSIPSGITIRPQKGIEDYPEYISAFNEAFREDFAYNPLSEEHIKHVDQYVRKTNLLYNRIFALEGNKIIGMVIPFGSSNPEQKHIGTIGSLGVRPSYQRRGIGRSLLSSAIQWLRKQDCTIIELGVSADNEDALGLYKKFGFYELKSQKFVTYSIKQNE
ncbi:MAG: GNAT family N-acetyltransferase [Candidatus Heimdallarchaeota archaeon]|nr:MAG: GNAT family N-acetyltransferase [Candidatus Heimdallarchaeota archaeon]